MTKCSHIVIKSGLDDNLILIIVNQATERARFFLRPLPAHTKDLVSRPSFCIAYGKQHVHTYGMATQQNARVFCFKIMDKHKSLYCPC